MKRNILSQFVAMALAFPVWVVEPSQAEASDENKIPEQGVQSFTLEGQKAGKKISGLMGKADSTARDILTKWGEYFRNMQSATNRVESMSLWLEGYAQGFGNNKDSAKVMKSNAKAVFEAFCIEGKLSPTSTWIHRKDEKGNLLYFVDKDKGEIEGNITTDSKIGKYPVIDKPEAEAPELLKKFEGGYGKWVKFAGELRRGGGGSSDTSTGTTSRAPRPMNVGQHSEIIGRLPTANGDQLASVVEKATTELAKRQGGAVLMFREIAHIANVLKAQAGLDKKLVEIAANIFDMAEAGVSAIQVAETQTGKFSTVPAPAQSGQTAAQVLRGDQHQQQVEVQQKTGTDNK